MFNWLTDEALLLLCELDLMVLVHQLEESENCKQINHALCCVLLWGLQDHNLNELIL